MTLLEFHFCDVEEKCKKINFTRTSILLLKIKIPHSLFKKKKKNHQKLLFIVLLFILLLRLDLKRNEIP